MTSPTTNSSLAQSGWHQACLVAATAWSVMLRAVRPSSWRRTVSRELGEQVSETGVGALGFVIVSAAAIGVAVVLPVSIWLGRLGQSGLLGPLLVTVVIRELAPLIVNVIVLGRSGGAMCAELGHLKVTRGVLALESRGIDPLRFLVMPRVVATMLSVLILTAFFIATCILSGYLFGQALQVTSRNLDLFADDVIRALAPIDILSLALKCLVPPVLTATVCALEGLSVEGDAVQVPDAVRRGLGRAVGVLILTFATLSIVTYL